MSVAARVKKIFSDDLISHTIIVFVGTNLAGFLNLLYHLVTVRFLTPQEYGTFNTLTVLVMSTSMAITPFGTTLTRFFTEYIAKNDFKTLFFTFKKLIKRLVFSALAVFAFFVLSAKPWALFLNTRPFYIIISGAIIALPLFSLTFPSLFQSFQKFKTYSFIGVFTSFSKLLTGALFMFLGWGVLGALSGFLIAPLAMFGVSLFFIPKILSRISPEDRKGPARVNLVPLYQYFFPVAVVMVSFTLLTGVDVILVKHFFSELDTGYYSIAQMVGKITLYLPSALAIVIFPKATTAFVRGTSPFKLLSKSLFLAFICCVTIAAFCFLWPDFILKLLTGKTNPVSSSLLGLFSLAMGFYALSWIIINFFLATHNLRILWPLAVLTLLQALTIYIWHQSLSVVLYTVLSYGAVCLLALLLLAVWVFGQKEQG